MAKRTPEDTPPLHPPAARGGKSTISALACTYGAYIGIRPPCTPPLRVGAGYWRLLLLHPVGAAPLAGAAAARTPPRRSPVGGADRQQLPRRAGAPGIAAPWRGTAAAGGGAAARAGARRCTLQGSSSASTPGTPPAQRCAWRHDAAAWQQRGTAQQAAQRHDAAAAAARYSPSRPRRIEPAAAQVCV